MKKIDKSELISMLASVVGSTFVTIVTETEPKLVGGKSCPLHGVKKRSKVNGTVGFNYTNAVNNQRAREGSEKDFVAEDRKWGMRMDKTPLVVHKDKYYLEVKVEKTDSPEYTLNGKSIPNEEVKQYIPAKGESRQELDKEIILRDYSLDSIREIKINKGEFCLV